MKGGAGDFPRRISQAPLISPDHNFEEFCLRMIGNDYRAVIDAAGAEDFYALVIHRHTTKEDDFPKALIGPGVQGESPATCLTARKGSIPPGCDPTLPFLQAANILNC